MGIDDVPTCTDGEYVDDVFNLVPKCTFSVSLCFLYYIIYALFHQTTHFLASLNDACVYKITYVKYEAYPD